MSATSSARRIYRWDLDKTYLETEFDTLRDMVRTAFQKAHQKVAVPGAAALIRELRAAGDSRLSIISGSPKQMRAVLEEKLKLDGVQWDELVLKDSIRNLVRGRFRALRGQVGYKLPILLESRGAVPAEAEEVLFGDDAEADAFIYSLYADLLARRVGPEALDQILEAAEVYPDDAERVRKALETLPRIDPVRRIFIRLDRLTPPGRFARYGSRLVPVFNYFQAALVLMGDGHLSAGQAMKVAWEILRLQGREEVAQVVPNLLTALGQGLVERGSPRAPPEAAAVDYLALLDDARPRP